MVEFEGLIDADAAVTDWLLANVATIPDTLVQSIRDIARENPSPVDRVVLTAELIYASRADIPASLQELGAALALVCARYDFHGLQRDNRGVRIAGALMRDAGSKRPTGMRAQDPRLDPDVAPQYQPQADSEPPVPPVAP